MLLKRKDVRICIYFMFIERKEKEWAFEEVEEWGYKRY